MRDVATPGGNEPLPVCIIHWNRPEECISSLDAFRNQQVAVRFVIVDNGSAPAALEQIVGHAPDAEVVRLGKNIGFGPAANVGLEYIFKSGPAELVVVAPHDALPQPGCLHRLVVAMTSHPRAGMASADYGIPQRQRFNWLRGIYLMPCQHRLTGWESSLFPYGTLMIFRRACLDAVGVFDERFFAYAEEQDLGLRAHAEGWEVGVVPEAIVHNPIRAASGPVTCYLNLRNSLLLVYNHAGAIAAVVRTFVMLANAIVVWFVPHRRFAGDSTLIRLRAISDFWRGRFGPPLEDLGRSGGNE